MRYAIFFVPIWFAVLSGAGADASPDNAPPLTAAEAVRLLRTAKEPAQFEKAALAVCSLGDEKLLGILVARLQENAVFSMLYKEEEKLREAREIRIMEAIAKFGGPKAEAALLELENTNWSARTEALTRAYGWLRKPSPAVFEVLDKRRHYSCTGALVETALHLDSPEAYSCLEKFVLRRNWDMRPFVRRRNDLRMVRFCTRLVSSGVTKTPGLVEAMFSDRWLPANPSRADASTEVLHELLKLAEAGLKLDLSKELRGVVEVRVEHIQLLLDEHTPPPATVAAALAALKDRKTGPQVDKAVMVLCKSADPKAIDAVLERLNDKAFLDWSTDGIYLYYVQSNLEDRILKHLAQMPSPKGEEALLSLTKSKNCMLDWGRDVVAAFRWVEKPSEKVYAYLETADGGEAPLVIIGTARAYRGLEKRWLLPGNKLNLDFGAINLYNHRTRPKVVKLYLQVLKRPIEARPDGVGGTAQQQRDWLVLCLLSPGNPMEVYDPTPDSPYLQPPPWKDAATGTLKDLLTAADLALNLDVSDRAKVAVRKSKQQIEAILAERREHDKK